MAVFAPGFIVIYNYHYMRLVKFKFWQFFI